MASAAAAAVDAEAPSQLYRESARAIFSGLSAHFNDPRLSDLLLVRPDGRGIHSHQVVLASCSRKFAGVLASGEATGKELPIQGVDPSALETVIGFFYRGEILLTPYTVVPIYDVCLKLEVPGLSGGCEQYLSSNMSPATCPVFLESAVSLLLEPLVKRCLAYAKTRFEEVVGSPSFQSLSTEAMRLLLGHVRSSVDDIGLAKALARWAVQKQERLAECEALFKELKLTTSALLQLLQSPDLISSLGAPGPAPAAGATTGPGAAGGAGAGQGPGGPGPRGQDKGEQQQQHKQGSTASPGSGPGGAGGPARGPPNFERSSHPNPERPASGLPPALERASMPNILDRPSGPNLERSSLTLGGAEATGLASGGSGPAPAMFARVSGPRSPSLSGGTRPDKGGLAGDTEGGLDAGAGPGSIRGSNTGLAGTGPGLGWSASGVGGGPGAGQGAGGPPGRGGQLPSFARWSAPADSFRAGPGSGRDLGRGLDDHDNRMMRRPPPGRSPLRMAGIDLEGPGLDGGGGGTVAVPVAALEQAGLTVSMTPSGGLAASGGPLGSLQVPLQVQVQPGAGPNAPLMVALPSALAQQLHAALTDPASLRAASRGGGGGGGGGGFGGRGGGLDPLGPGIDVQEPGGLAAVPPRFGIGSGPGRGIPGGPELLGPPLGGLRGTLGPGPGRGARGGPPGGWGAGGSDAGLLALAAAGGAAGSLPGLGGPPLPNGSGGPGGGGGLGGPGGKRRRQSPEEADPDHIEEISTRGGRRGGGTPGSKAPLLCHVDDCQVDLSNLKEYHQRFRICDYHLKASTVLRDGIQQRFCQQCGRFHLLSEFDGTKRSCRARLQRHNARRRKRPEPREGEEPRRPQQRNPGFGGGQQLSGPLSLQGLYGSVLPNMARSSDPGVEALVSLRGGAPPGGLGGDMGLSLDPLPGQFRQQMDIQRELMRLQRGRAGQQPSRQEQLLRLQGYDLGGPDYGHGAGGMEGDDDDLGPDGDDGGPGDDGDEDDGMEGEDPLAPLPSQPPPPPPQQGRSNMPPLQLLQQLGLPLLAVKEEEGRQGGGTGPRGPQGAGQQQHEAQQQQPAAERPPSRGGAEGSRAGAEGRGGAGAGGGGSGAGGSGSGAAGGGSGGAVAVKLEPGSPGEAGAQAGPGEQAAMGAGGGGRSQPQPQPERERERERERDPAGGGGGRPRGEEPSAGGADSRTVTQSPGHGQEAGVEVEQGAPKGAAN